MGNGHDRDHRIGARGSQQIDRGVDVAGAAERRGGLQQNEDVGPVPLAPLERGDEVRSAHPASASRRRRDAAGRRNGTSTPSCRATPAISSSSVLTTTRVSRLLRPRGVGRIRQQRPPAEEREILPRNPFGSAARGNDTEDVQVLNPLLDVQRRARQQVGDARAGLPVAVKVRGRIRTVLDLRRIAAAIAARS